MAFCIWVGLGVIISVALLSVTSFVIFSMTNIIASGEEADESLRDDDDDLVMRIGEALELVLNRPYF